MPPSFRYSATINLAGPDKIVDALYSGQPQPLGKKYLRGLHHQIKQLQGKLVLATRGEVFDIAVDLRSDSPTFGQRVGNPFSGRISARCGCRRGLRMTF